MTTTQSSPATVGRAGDWNRESALVQALDECSPDLHEHVGNVAALAEVVSRAYGLREVDVQLIRLAAELHDVGKVAIPKVILDKPGPLSDDEWAVMHRHTVIGERIVGSCASLAPAAQLVRSSHERYDGTGYPDGLCAGEIEVGARIIAVCDAYDAMLSDRVYRKSRSTKQALAELRRCAGTQFDPAIVELFCSTISRRDSGVQGRSLRSPAPGVSSSRDDLTKWRTRRETGAQTQGPHGEVAQSP
jgi:putative nucleotidyltransferase with HDIG domain